MRVSRLATAAATLLLLALSANGPAFADKKLPFQTVAQLKSKCKAADGVYMPPDSSGVYACASKKNDSVAVCGGPGKYAKSCVAREAPRDPKGGLGKLRPRSLAQ